MNYTSHRLRSRALANERDVFVHLPDSGPCDTLLLFLDAELYRDRVGAQQVVADLVADGRLAGPAVVFVSYQTRDARWIECPCHPPFVTFVVDELLPWLAQHFPTLAMVRQRVLIGLSYTGLAASWVALERPVAFQAVVSQSGSYWWNQSWLNREYRIASGVTLPRFYLDVGNRETEENVRHKEDVLQEVSQIAGVREFRDKLVAAGADVRYLEFDGGHDPAGWLSMLPVALTWAATRHSASWRPPAR